LHSDVRISTSNNSDLSINIFNPPLSLKTRTSIREVARVIGLLVSSFSAVDYGKLFYRNLERAKIEALNNFRGNVDAFMHITSEMKLDLFWWIENIYAQVLQPPILFMYATAVELSQKTFTCLPFILSLNDFRAK
jgi:hypothetical protein